MQVAKPGEVVERSTYATTSVASDGALKTQAFTEAVNYESAGKWRSIDRDLVRGADGDVHPEAMDGDLAIPPTLAEPVEIAFGGRRISLRLLGAGGDRETSGPTAEFEDALAGVDVEYEARSSGLKERIILQRANSQRVFRYALSGGDDLSATQAAGNLIELKNGAGKQLFSISAPLAWDSAEPASESLGLTLSVEKKAPGSWIVTMRGDDAWLDDPARRYPVTIDPDVQWQRNGWTSRSLGANTDCYITNVAPNNSLCSSPLLRVGGEQASAMFSSLLHFDLKGVIPAAAEVENSSLLLWETDTNAKPATVMQARPSSSQWGSAASWNKRNPTTAWTTPGGDVTTDPYLIGLPTAVSDVQKTYRFELSSTAVQGWVEGSLPNYGVQISAAPGSPSTQAYNFASSDVTDITKKPRLEITWHPVMSDVVREAVPSIAQAWALDTGAGDFGCDDTCSFLRDSDVSASPDKYLLGSPSDVANRVGQVPAGQSWGPARVGPSTGPPSPTAARAVAEIERTAAQVARRGAYRAGVSLAFGGATMLSTPVLVLAGAGVAAAAGSYVVYKLVTKNGGKKKIVFWVPPDPNSLIYSWVRPQNATYPKSPGTPDVIVPPGFVAEFSQQAGTAARLWRTGSSSESPCNTPPVSPPLGAVSFIWQDATHCASGNDGEVYSHGWYVPYTTMLSEGLKVAENPPEANSDIRSATNPDITKEEAESLVQEALDSGGLTLNKLLSAQLGDGAFPEYPSATMPDCTGLTTTACDNLLQQVGLVGQLKITEVPVEDGDPELPPGAVLDTRPSGGGPWNTRAPIEILENPRIPIPPYLPEEEQIADALRSNNPVIRDREREPLTRPLALQVAKKCRTVAIGASVSPNLCKLRPILVIAGGDAYEPAKHDAEAIRGMPIWAQLHRRKRALRMPGRGFNYEWHTGTEPCKSGPRRTDVREECDEYPFGASFEGYFGSQTFPWPSVKRVIATQNNREGQVVRHFYRKSGISLPGQSKGRPMNFAGCGRQLRPNPQPTVANAQAAAPLPDSDYLVVPMPYLELESFALCNSAPLPGHEAWDADLG